jgi:hypothetical protein
MGRQDIDFLMCFTDKPRFSEQGGKIPVSTGKTGNIARSV